MKSMWNLVVCGCFAISVVALSGCKTMEAAGQQAGSLTSQEGKKQLDNQGGTSGIMKTLIDKLGSKDPQEKESTMGKIVSMGKTAVPALVGVLKSDDKPAEVKKGALETLGKMGSTASPAKDEVQKMTQSSDPGIKEAATNALQKITGK